MASSTASACPGCAPETLARRGIVHVQHCAACRCVSIHLGAVTVRVEEGALGAVADTLVLAAHALDEQRDGARDALTLPRGFA